MSEIEKGKAGDLFSDFLKEQGTYEATTEQAITRRQDAANKRNRERKKLMAKHFGGCCKDCGVSYPQYVYEFHHTDPKQKDVNPSKALSWSEERMWKELNKCVMLCSNCHKIRHHSLGECEDTR